MAEEGFIEEFDPYKDTLNDVIRKYYKGSTKLTRFTSERGADFDLGNMTIADAIRPGEDGSASPIKKRLQQLERKVAQNEAKPASTRNFRQLSHYVLGAAKSQLPEDHPLYKEIPTADIKGAEAERFWGSIIADKGQAAVSVSIHPDALESWNRELKKYEAANPHDKATVDAIRVMYGMGQRPSTISQMVYSEYYTKNKVLAVVPERVVFTDKETGEVIEDFTLPENKAKQEEAIKKIIQRTGVAKGPQEIGRSKALMLNIPVDEEVDAAIARRMAANSQIPEFAKLLEDRVENEFKLFVFTKPDGTPVLNKDVNEVLRQIRVTYRDEDPRTGQMIEKGILYDAESGLYFDTLAPTAEEVREAGEQRGYKNLSIKTGSQLFRGWYDSRLQAAGVSETSAKILQGRKLDIQKIGGYGHPTAGQVGKPIRNVAVNVGRWTASQSLPVTKEEIKQYGVDTAEEVKDIKGQIVASQIAEGKAPSPATANFRTNPNPANLEQRAIEEAPDLRESFDLSKEVKTADQSSAKLLENIQYKNNIVAELRGEPILDSKGNPIFEPTLDIPKDAFANLSNSQISDIANDFTSKDEFNLFWNRHGDTLLEIDNVQVSDFLDEYNKFKPATGRGMRGASMRQSVKGSPDMPVSSMSPTQQKDFVSQNMRPWETMDQAEDRLLFNSSGTLDRETDTLSSLSQELRANLDAPPVVSPSPVADVEDAGKITGKTIGGPFSMLPDQMSDLALTEDQIVETEDEKLVRLLKKEGIELKEAPTTTSPDAPAQGEPIPEFLRKGPKTEVEKPKRGILSRLGRLGKKLPVVGGFIGPTYYASEAMAEKSFRDDYADQLSISELDESIAREQQDLFQAMEESPFNPIPVTTGDKEDIQEEVNINREFRQTPEFKEFKKKNANLKPRQFSRKLAKNKKLNNLREEIAQRYFPRQPKDLVGFVQER